MQTPITTAGASPAKSEASSLRQIKKLHGSILHAARTSLNSAIRIGELLDQIRLNIPHGQWLPWIQKNLPFSERTAQNYIRCFAQKDRLKNANVADLSGAYLLLSEGKPEPADTDFKPLDARVRQSLADVREAVLEYPAESDFPTVNGSDARVTQDGFDDFIKSQGIALGKGDLIPLMVIGEEFEAGRSVPAGMILELFQAVNPARKGVAA
jgi:hypothetical protein